VPVPEAIVALLADLAEPAASPSSAS
jgi:hypothetical protein